MQCMTRKILFDPEEVLITNSIDLKLKEFENIVNNLNFKEKNIQNEKEKIEHDINTAFATLSKALDDRKVTLLQKLNDIMKN